LLGTLETRFATEGLSYHYDHDGSLVIKGRFPAEQGALIVKALEMAMERQFAEKADVGAPHGRDRAGTALPQEDANVSAETTESSEPEPIATRRADALAEMVETYMNSEPVPNATADRYQVVVHVVDHTGTDRGHGPLLQDDPHIEDGPHVFRLYKRQIRGWAPYSALG